MTETHTRAAARVAPAADAPLTEQISSLVSRETRAYLLGSVEADETRGEGVVIRALLDLAIAKLRDVDPDEYYRRVDLGIADMGRRDARKAAREASTTTEIAAVTG